MRSRFWGALGGLLVLLNWAFFLTVTLLIWAQTGDFTWIQNLHWTYFLTDLSGLFEMAPVPAGSVLLAWLLLTACFTLAWLSSPSPRASVKKVPVIAATPPTPDAVGLRQDAIESRPELQEKLRRLNRWLSQA
jgi:hypothetical protein